MLPRRDGWNVMLDTQLGVVRAYSTGGWLREDSVEWRRHGDVPDSQFERNEAIKTEYRRAPLVRAAHYFSELIYAYRSLKRLPIIDAHRSEPYREGHPPPYSQWAFKNLVGNMYQFVVCYAEVMIGTRRARNLANALS
jgi:hypothetical protein